MLSGKMEYTITKSPLMVNWNYSYKCNLNCKHCYSRLRNRNDDATLEEKIRIADNLIKNSCSFVNLGGGEPIIVEDIYEVISYLTKHNMYVSLSTNGTFITEEVANKLQGVNLSAAAISVDNINKDMHNNIRGYDTSFDDAINASKMLIKRNVDVIFSTVVTSENCNVLEDIINLAIKIGCKGISLKRLKMMGSAIENDYLSLNEDQVNKLYSDLRVWKKKYSDFRISFNYSHNKIEDIDGGCPCGKSSVAITPNGNIIPCVYNDVLVLGNAITDDLSEIWTKSDTLKKLRNDFQCLGMMITKGEAKEYEN